MHLWAILKYNFSLVVNVPDNNNNNNSSRGKNCFLYQSKFIPCSAKQINITFWSASRRVVCKKLLKIVWLPHYHYRRNERVHTCISLHIFCECSSFPFLVPVMLAIARCYVPIKTSKSSCTPLQFVVQVCIFSYKL